MTAVMSPPERIDAAVSPVPPFHPRGARAPICIAVHQGFSVRYMLQTDILVRLMEHGCPITVLAPAHECDHIRSAVRGPIRIVPLPPMPPSRRLTRWLRTMRHFLHPEAVSTADEIYKRMLSEAPSARHRLQLRCLRFLARSASLARPLRRAVPWMEGRWSQDGSFTELLRSLAPGLVVVTSTGVFGHDTAILRAARKLGLPTGTVILSWDNTSSTGYPAGFSDYLIAWTETMKREAVQLLDYRREQVFVKGVAHFDVYHRPDPGYDRANVLSNLGLNPEKRTLVLATKSPNAYACNPHIAEALAEAAQDGRLPDCQVIIRVHPIHYRRDAQGHLLYGETLEAYERLVRRYGHVRISAPRVEGTSRGHVMTGDEMTEVARLLRASDVLINMYSTMNIEGALLDKPIVNVCFEWPEASRPDGANPARFDINSDAAEYHNMRIADSGGTRIAYSPRELIEHVQAYLAMPELDQEGRRAIARVEGGPFPGYAGRMIADTLVHLTCRGAPAGI
jgi:hypothetical protein